MTKITNFRGNSGILRKIILFTKNILRVFIKMMKFVKCSNLCFSNVKWMKIHEDSQFRTFRTFSLFCSFSQFLHFFAILLIFALFAYFHTFALFRSFSLFSAPLRKCCCSPRNIDDSGCRFRILA